MNAIVPCMSWVPIFWRDLLGLFYRNNQGMDADKSFSNSETVISLHENLVNGSDLPVLDIIEALHTLDDSLHNLLIVDDTLHSSLAIANKPLSDSVVVSSIDNLVEVVNPPSDLLITDNPLPSVVESLSDAVIEDSPFHTLAVVDKLLSKSFLDLPDLPCSIVEDILSRLPPKCIFQCQRHSKALHAITRTSYFAQMQGSRPHNLVTVVQRFPDCDSDSFIELYFIDAESHNIERKTTDIVSCYKSKDNPVSIVGSYDGFILFTNLNLYGWAESVYYLWNPVTNEKMTWRESYRHVNYVCGFYFCYVRKEYVLLLVSAKAFRYEVEILNIRTKVSKYVGNCSYPPSRGRSPVIINRTLYWMVDQILYSCLHDDWPSHSDLIVSFDMETERFTAISHSGRIGKPYFQNGLLHLIAFEGELCLCDPISWTEIELSVLNHKTKCWEKRHTVILPMCSGIVRPNVFWGRKNNTRVVHHKKGELLVRHINRLYTYDLHSCSFKTVEIGFGDFTFQVTVHVDNLASFEGMDNIIFD